MSTGTEQMLDRLIATMQEGAELLQRVRTAAYPQTDDSRTGAVAESLAALQGLVCAIGWLTTSLGGPEALPMERVGDGMTEFELYKHLLGTAELGREHLQALLPNR